MARLQQPRQRNPATQQTYNAVPPPPELANAPDREGGQFLDDHGRDRRAELSDVVTPPRRIPRPRPDGRNREEGFLERGRRADLQNDISQVDAGQLRTNRR